MPIGDHYPRGERLSVIIVTVDTATSRIEGVGKDAAVIQISVNNKPPAFRWPKEGEAWVICRNGYEWYLESRLEDADSIALNEGEPGDLMGPDGWIPQSALPVRVTDELPTNFEFRDENGDWNPYEAPGVAPEIEISDDEPTDPARTVWIDTDEEGVDFNNWANLDARLDTIETRPVVTRVYNAAASPWTLGDFAGASISGVRIHMHGRLFYSGAVGLLMLGINGLSNLGTDWMVQRFYFSSGTPGTDIQGAAFATSQNGIFLSHVGWASSSNAYVNLWGILHTNNDATFHSWQGRYSNNDGTNTNNRIDANVVSNAWGAPEITSLSVFHNGTTPTFTGTITTEVIT